jgi:tetratricopeptide (TPR) repeat protein
MQQVHAGLKLDPLNNWFRIELGARLAWQGKHEEALEVFLQVASDDPNWFMIYRYLWEIHFYRGETEKALGAAKKFYELSGQTHFREALSDFNAGNEYSAAMGALASVMTAHSTKSYVSDFELARIFAFAGDKASTLQWLERAEANRDTQLVYSAAQPVFSLVWTEPRYTRLRQKMNLPE